MERGYVQAAVLISAFFLLLPATFAFSTIPIDSLCEGDSVCSNQCTSLNTYAEYECVSGFCQSTIGEHTCPSGTLCQGGNCVSTSSSSPPPGSIHYCSFNTQSCLEQPDSINYCEGYAYIHCPTIQSIAQNQGHPTQQGTTLLPVGWNLEADAHTAVSTQQGCQVPSMYQPTLQGCQDQGYVQCEEGSEPFTEPREQISHGDAARTFTPIYAEISCKPEIEFITCSENEELVNGNCECQQGYERNQDTGLCVLGPDLTSPVCGSAAGSYAVTATNYRSGWCEEGSASQTPNTFLGVGGTTSWYCTTPTSQTTCTATRAACGTESGDSGSSTYWDGTACVPGPAVSVNVQVDGLPRNNVYVDQNPDPILQAVQDGMWINGTTGPDHPGGYLGGYFRTRASNQDVRVASLGNFSIYYKVSEKEIIITAFWDNRQDPEKLLKILKNKK